MAVSEQKHFVLQSEGAESTQILPSTCLQAHACQQLFFTFRGNATRNCEETDKDVSAGFFRDRTWLDGKIDTFKKCMMMVR